MGILVNQTSGRSKLQERIEADLRAKAVAASDGGDAGKTDFAEDQEYLKDLRTATNFPWLRTVVIFTTVVLAAVLFFVI